MGIGNASASPLSGVVCVSDDVSMLLADHHAVEAGHALAAPRLKAYHGHSIVQLEGLAGEGHPGHALQMDCALRSRSACSVGSRRHAAVL